MENTENIKWSVLERFEKVDGYAQEITVVGFDSDGCQYIANAVESCGEIDSITDIEKTGNYEFTLKIKTSGSFEVSDLKDFINHRLASISGISYQNSPMVGGLAIMMKR